MTLDDLRKFKQRLEQIDKEHSRCEGKLQQVLSQCKKDFRCTSQEELEALREELQELISVERQKFQREVNSFNERWKGKF